MTTLGDDDEPTPVISGEIESKLIIRTLPIGIRLLLTLLGFPPFLWLVMFFNLWQLHSGRMDTVLLALPWISSFALSLWIPDLLTRFEAVVLVPLGITSILLAMIYFSQRVWWLGAWFVFLWLLVGGFGASLHPKMTPSRLAKGTIFYPNDPEPGSLKEMTPREGSQLAIVMFKTSLASGVSIALLSYHNGFGPFRAGMLGLAAIVVGPLAAFLYAVLTAIPLRLVSHRKPPPKAQV